MNRILLWVGILLLLLGCCGMCAQAEGYEACHRVTMLRESHTLENGAAIHIAYAKTALASVDETLRTLVASYCELYEPMLAALSRAEAADTRLDVGVQYSRTGTRWLSFLVYARMTRAGIITSTELTTRVYDMHTGARVTLSTLFEEDSAVWNILEAGVRKAFLRSYPSLQSNARVTEQLLRRESLRMADFTLHGMSLVLHYPAAALFEGKSSIIQVPFYYPELYGHMRAEAYEQTDNKRYYSMVCLTFNDGPNPTATPRLLNALADKGVRASFFVVGSRIEGAAALVQRERDEGHAVGAHNWLHADPSGWPQEAIRAIRTRVDDVLAETTGMPSEYNSAAYGVTAPFIDAQAGWALIAWSVQSDDMRGGSPQRIAARVQAQTRSGDIILCHDTVAHTDRNASILIDALEDIGYMFLTVDEMFAKDRVPFLGNLVYYRCEDGDFSER
jgi:peptidoglycan/xylan/chitin deacetylase (PgdA/CDA1 family)